MTETMVVERLEHGCPNCGKPWVPGAEWPSQNSVIVFQHPKGGRAGLKICDECLFDPKRINRKRILSTLRGLQWPQEKLHPLGVAIDLHKEKVTCHL